MADYTTVGKSVKKIDALSLAMGTEPFTADYPLDSPLVLKFMYSDLAHADIVSLDASRAEALDGVAGVFHFWNCPDTFYTTAGQGYPEPSAYDNRLFDHKVRFVGDRICMVAAETSEIAEEAISLIDLEMDPLPALFDPELARDPDSPRLHADGEYMPIPVRYQPEENVCAGLNIPLGDVESGMKEADFIVEHRYTTHQASHAAMEPHVVACYLDPRDRVVLVTATQVPFHVRRIVGRVLDIPIQRIRVIKPRIGGGFGGKQEVLLEPYAALATLRTGRSTFCEFTRSEVFVSSRTRHPMRVDFKMGVKNNGEITALVMDALMDSGAYGSHGLTVLSNAGAKVLPLFNKIPNMLFTGSSVYTNLPVGGAYRGYGATQSYFGFNQHIDMIARKLGVDFLDYCKKWHIKEGETSDIFRILGEGKEGVSQVIGSCGLGECIDVGAAAIGWKEKRGRKQRGANGAIRGVGAAVMMQGSGIPKIDMGGASIKLNEDGSFNLAVGATDLGTGSDTILIQIAAEALKAPPEKFEILSSDTDLTPFDVGAYASSTTYISGGAVKKCALAMLDQLQSVAAEALEVDKETLRHEPECFTDPASGKSFTFEQIGYRSFYAVNQAQLQANASHTSDVSPPPFLAQFAEVEVDPETGVVRVVEFVSAVDCGQPINPILAEGQVEGAAVNGISFALSEQFVFNRDGRVTNAAFGRYGIYTTADMPRMQTFLVPTDEENGPFGAKSVGEIAINGPAPAIANAIFDAVGIRLYDLPMTPERVFQALQESRSQEEPSA
ncbi:MAG: molybdopterin-dependent oxidoreductase [Spirochaetales bacterium]|nr:molybdopterin-dependent oxidoreductase [Spirochaetales bacterium]